MRRLLLLFFGGGAFITSAQSLPDLLIDLSTDSQARLSWTETPGNIVLEATDTLTLWQPFPRIPTLSNGQFSVLADITGGARFFRLHETGGLPPDPASVATPIPQGVATPLAGSTEFLYTGPNPIQTGVAPGTIEARRAAVVRGKVRKRDDTPLSGVTISILDHPEFGQTFSRADGTFDLVVNGGGLLTVNYEKTDFCSVQRQIHVPWQDYATVQDVVMIQMDPAMTPVALGINSPMQVHQGSMQTDADGARRATILFMPGTSANLVLANGATQSVSSLNVRATEFTVGGNGPHAMPGELPPSTGYTYCVDLSADEATAAGAKEVRFSSPVAVYVENFVGFPVGSLVPAGFYDRGKGQWVASDNGRVIKVISLAGGLADLDLDGNGTIDDSTALAAFGITDDERRCLASLYPPGQELWRVLLPHFTPWDINWPWGPPPDSEPPGDSDPEPGPNPNKPPKGGDNEECGSIIGCESQTLGEVISVTGAPFRLHYQSERVPGRREKNILKIRLSGATLPPNLQRIHLDIAIAGQAFKKVFAPQPNLFDTFDWDGKDAYGRPVQGQQPVKLRIGYEYIAQYYATPDTFAASFNRFGLPPIATGSGGGGGGGGTVSFTNIAARTTTPPIILWQDYEASLGRFDNFGLAPGWSLSIHHAYDVAGLTLYTGNGGQRSARAEGVNIYTVAGTGVTGFAGDGGMAAQARLNDPVGVAVGSDGSLYIADSNNNRIRRVGPDGIITTVAGTGDFGFAGDGGLATQARLFHPRGVAVGSDGSLYIADSKNNRIRRVGPDGIITTVAGTGVSAFSGDGGPATQAGMAEPQKVVVGQDGSLYIAAPSNYRIRRVGPDGIITTVAGTGNPGFSVDGGPATKAHLKLPWDVALGFDGGLYIADRDDWRIRRVGPDGIITTAAALLNPIVGVALGSDGSLYINEASGFNNPGNRIRRVGSDGVVATVGTGDFGFAGDGGPAARALLAVPQGVAVGPDGSLYVADTYNQRIRQLRSSLPRSFGSDIVIAAEAGSELYVFTDAGRHLRTLDALTGAVLFQFTYTSANLLATITDGAGNVTTIERDGSDKPSAIVAPFGQRTSLAINADGFLSRVTHPAGEAVQLTYNSGNAEGLVATLTDPRGNVHRYMYDSLGLLTRDENPAGGVKTLTRTDISDDHYTVTVTTALGLVTTYEVEELSTGDTRRMRVQPGGVRTESLFRSDASRRVSYPDGTVADLIEGPDPRFGMQVPILTNVTIATPGGITTSRSATRTATLADPNNLLSLTSQIDTVQINGATSSRTYDSALRKSTTTLPTGRQFQGALDAEGRTTQVVVPGLAAVNLVYNIRGRLASVAQDNRTLLFTYGADGFLASVRNSLGTEIGFGRDGTGRLIRLSRPDGTEVTLSRDASGHVTSLTPPTRPPHLFDFSAIGLLTKATPPDLGPLVEETSYLYNLDGELASITRPNATVTIACDAFGRFQVVSFPGDSIGATYDTVGRVAMLTTAAGVGLAYRCDGRLITETQWTGSVIGRVNRTYNNDLQVTERMVNGGNAISLGYDNDGALIQAGALTIQRDVANGLFTGTTLGNLVETVGRNAIGEVTSYAASFAGSNLLGLSYGRDAIGRVETLTETIGGTTRAFGYEYDGLGRLREVTLGGVPVANYTYDAVGNRLSGPGVGGGFIYDAQDRLLQHGNTSYTYTPSGELATKSAGGQTTYVHDAVGRLRSVVKPNGMTIEYVVDGRGRRIGKRVDGTLVQGFLYQNGREPVAELDGSNAIVSIFVYGSRGNVPDYMIRQGTTYRILSDQIGSPRLVIRTSDGAIVQRIDYDEFGRVVLDTQPDFQPFGFAGGQYDRDTGLVHLGARDYDPDVGRWTSKDASGFFGGLNLYAYAHNDPVNWVDPTGNNALAAGFVGGGTIALGGPLTIAGGAALGGAFLAAGLYAGIEALPELIDTFGNIVEENADPTHDDEGRDEGGVVPNTQPDGGTCPPTPFRTPADRPQDPDVEPLPFFPDAVPVPVPVPVPYVAPPKKPDRFEEHPRFTPSGKGS